jgi:hypothetical protein
MSSHVLTRVHTALTDTSAGLKIGKRVAETLAKYYDLQTLIKYSFTLLIKVMV